MSRYTINRPDLPPVAFSGKLIGSADSRDKNPSRRPNRWVLVDIYRLTGGSYLVAKHNLVWKQKEEGQVTVEIYPSPDEAIRALSQASYALGPTWLDAVSKACKEDLVFAKAWSSQKQQA